MDNGTERRRDLLMNETIMYYNTNAEEFYNGTVNADMSDLYTHFEKYIKPGASVLDCGCGSGRDSRYFMQRGYDIEAIDASCEMCKKTEELIGKKVICMSFNEIEAKSEYDGIWACASLLHEEKEKLPNVISKLEKALKPNGIIYMSFKYGEFCGLRNGRYFVNMTEESMDEILSSAGNLRVIESWITGDVREGRESEMWLNVIVKK